MPSRYQPHGPSHCLCSSHTHSSFACLHITQKLSSTIYTLLLPAATSNMVSSDDEEPRGRRPSLPTTAPLRLKKPKVPKGLGQSILRWVGADDSVEITDYKSALRFLDPGTNDGDQIGDDYIIALAGAKRAESTSASHQEKVNKAVQIIASQRQSSTLQA